MIGVEGALIGFNAEIGGGVKAAGNELKSVGKKNY